MPVLKLLVNNIKIVFFVKNIKTQGKMLPQL